MAWTERYVRADADGSGDGTTDANSGANGAWTLAQAITSAAAGQRINVKTGTYAYTTTAMSFVNDGTATSIILWRGFDTAIGDLDVEPYSASLTRPTFSTTTGQLSFNVCNFNTFENIIFTSSGNDILAGTDTSELTFLRCSFSCTWANSVGYAFFFNASNAHVVFIGCSFSATTTATSVVSTNGSTSDTRFFGCCFTGGGAGFTTSSTYFVDFINCVFNTHTTYGIRINTDTAVRMSVVGCTFYNCTTACISTGATQANTMLLLNNAFVSSGLGFDLTDSELVVAVSSVYYSLTSGLNAGTGDVVSVSETSDATQPLVNPPTDMTLKSSSGGAGAAFPQPFTGEAYYHYADIGAVNRKHAPLIFSRQATLLRQ